MPVTVTAQILALRTGVEGSLSSAAQSSTNAAPPGSEQQRPPSLPWQPGTRVSAQVEAKLVNGNTLLRIGSLPFEVRLPLPAQPGERLELEYLGNSPRVTFALAPQDTPELAQPQRETAVQISAGARALIDALRTAQAERAGAGSAAPLQDPVPLLPAPPRDGAAALPAALKQALVRSGLFYESHVAQWAGGERPLAELLREPQGRLSSAQTAAVPSPKAEAEAGAARSVPAQSAASRPDATAIGADTQRGTPIHPQTLPQVASQLDALAHHQIIWQGQAWPGQFIEWRIDEPPEHEPGQPAQLDWTTQLRLSLPQLGEVRADLVLGAQGLRVRIAAGDGAAAPLRAAQAGLERALAEASIRLLAFAVVADD